jgi:hypothetical protein
MGSILGLLENNKTFVEIAEYLCRIESEYMGLTPKKDNALVAAQTLLQHNAAIDEGCA